MSFEIEEWEIWHTYTTYLDSGPFDLPKAAHSLLQSGVALCAMESSGRTYWRTAEDVACGNTEIDSQATSFTLVRDKDSQSLPDGFALEAWGQAAYFLIGEQRVLGDSPALSDPYLRAFLGKCVVTKLADDGSESHLNLYPVLLVFESGVLILEFRLIGSTTKSIATDRFIDGAVNLFRESFSQVEVNPGLARNATTAYYHSARPNFFQRARMLWLQGIHNRAIEERTRPHSDDDFSFELSPWSGQTDDLRSIALTIFHTCSFLIIGPRRGISFLFFGQPALPELGEYWSGRPHIHIIRFEHQKQTSAENHKHFGSEFARILARTTSSSANITNHLPQDARLFEDFNAYITAPCLLWVWSKKGLADQAATEDPNRGNFIYERQALMELLEYGYMLHRGLYHRVEQLSSTAQVMRMRKDILRLRLRMRESSHSGEIRELLENGWKELGLPTLVSEIESALSLRESDMRSSDNMRTTRLGWGIAAVFGFVAVPGLADQFITPFWSLSKIHPVADVLKAKLIADGLAILLIAFILTLVLFLLSLRRDSR